MPFLRLAAATRCLLVLFAAAGALCARPAASHAAYGNSPPRCGGDCDRDRTVAINELITGVNIAVGAAPLAQCVEFDCMRSGSVTIACLIAGVNAALGGCPSLVADPLVEGPVSGGLGAPFVASTAFDLAEVGYAEAEYFVAGTAAAYVNTEDFSIDGRWQVAPSGTTAAYKTRVLVYRPIDAERFNGTVIVEWLNVSGGLDSAADWIMGHTELTREGYVWVGVSAQRVGVEGGESVIGLPPMPLKMIDPLRYGSLVHPGDSFSYDIYSQVAQAIWYPGATNLLGGLKPKAVIAAGESQSAFRMVTYINALHPLADIYDGFLVHSRSSGGAALSDPPNESIRVPRVVFLRDDLRAPVLTFQTESDVLLFGSYATRQIDSPSLRLWEVAGTAHADTYTVSVGREDRGDSPDAALLVVTAEPLPELGACASPINSGPQHFVLKAAIAALNRWVREGTPPEIAPRLDVLAGPPFTLQLDDSGNARGGIRTPQLDVPIATFSGLPQGGAVICALFGSTAPFDDARLVQLYSTPAEFVAAFEVATDAAVAAGHVRPADALLMKAAAQDVDFGG